MPSERKYPLAKTSWRVRPSALVTIVTDDSRRIATFPLQFITDGGINTWRYVIEVVEMLVDHDPQLPSLISDANGVAMLPHNAPTAGEFVYTQPGQASRVAVLICQVEHFRSNSQEGLNISSESLPRTSKGAQPGQDRPGPM